MLPFVLETYKEILKVSGTLFFRWGLGLKTVFSEINIESLVNKFVNEITKLLF